MNHKTVFSIYSEYTPNPNVMKFVSNQLLTTSILEFEKTPNATDFPLIHELFLLPFVKTIFLGSNFISIQKNNTIDWDDISSEIRILIQEKLNSGIQISTKKVDFKKTKKTKKEIIIEEILEKQIRPFVMQDGGDITLISFQKGIVRVLLKGACNGCPSSTFTLKQGIEKKLKATLGDDVKEVIAIN